MSVVVLAGERYAAGLDWMDRRGDAETARRAREYDRPFVVHWRSQTGYGPGEPESADGLPSLAAALSAHLDAASFVALVEGQGGRFALVRSRNGLILADGDETFDAREAAIAAFERARQAGGWGLHATPGLVEGAVDLDRPPPAEEHRLSAAPRVRSPAAPLAAGGFLVLLLAAGAAWHWQDTLRRWYAGPPPVPPKQAPAPEPQVLAAFDPVALIEGCRREIERRPPWLPAWQLHSLTCEAAFADAGLAPLHPEIRGRPALAARWTLPGDRPRPLHRQIAEARLADWPSAAVVDATAWALAPLSPVLRIAAEEPPTFRQLRRVLDRRLGTAGVELRYAPKERRVTLRTGHPLPRIAALVAAVPGLEITSLSREGGGWRLEGRPLQPASLPESRFRELTGETLR